MVRTLRNFIRKIINYFMLVIEEVMSLHPRLSSIYYGFFSSAMAREHYAVLNGRIRYRKNIKYSISSSFLLRRNTHRLEKGLIMRPRREVFAKDYIEETIDAFISCSSLMCSTVDEPSTGERPISDELKWAQDVLEQYFEVTGDDEVINKQCERFQAALRPSEKEERFVPYQRDLETKQISFDQLYALSKLRRSVRWFSSKPVPHELVDNALLVGAQSPSACNRQPFQFRIYDDPELVNKIASIPMGTRGFAHQFPMVIVVTGHLDAYFSERDRHVIYIDASLASMGFLYGLEAQGLSSCVINWPEITEKEKQMSELLNLPPEERPIFLIAVGWPESDAMVPYSQKKPLEEIRSYNKQ